jgi:hypothetical protein
MSVLEADTSDNAVATALLTQDVPDLVIESSRPPLPLSKQLSSSHSLLNATEVRLRRMRARVLASVSPEIRSMVSAAAERSVTVMSDHDWAVVLGEHSTADLETRIEGLRSSSANRNEGRDHDRDEEDRTLPRFTPMRKRSSASEDLQATHSSSSAARVTHSGSHLFSESSDIDGDALPNSSSSLAELGRQLAPVPTAIRDRCLHTPRIHSQFSSRRFVSSHRRVQQQFQATAPLFYREELLAQLFQEKASDALLLLSSLHDSYVRWYQGFCEANTDKRHHDSDDKAGPAAEDGKDATERLGQLSSGMDWSNSFQREFGKLVNQHGDIVWPSQHLLQRANEVLPNYCPRGVDYLPAEYIDEILSDLEAFVLMHEFIVDSRDPRLRLSTKDESESQRGSMHASGLKVVRTAEFVEWFYLKMEAVDRLQFQCGDMF